MFKFSLMVPTIGLVFTCATAFAMDRPISPIGDWEISGSISNGFRYKLIIQVRANSATLHNTVSDFSGLMAQSCAVTVPAEISGNSIRQLASAHDSKTSASGMTCEVTANANQIAYAYKRGAKRVLCDSGNNCLKAVR